ncbi:methionyl-tRNA synthetase beta subunit [Cavenderia fasciculata]|uniref:Methionyl-tRNA synthetase beta subunit n=1 Tax=Cavenderia fasciculata TaxID=261658 RepID=F4PZN7_CACFS|nr:methionyl-tRNA synthetase beta subunit [Cavenderia fasciculata]EGG18801.1 methionyl-tRNA synthetase beta subunit [Cavenderia fasciculata]|eukprot:XP_004357263.1 methionyl-tRNA synthetase beta subunit [Cavenderia fasciculata]
MSDNSNTTSTTSTTSRIVESFQSWIKNIPFITRIILYTCVTLFLLDSVLSFFPTVLCYLSFNIYESWRLITSTLFHINLLHLLFNMMAFIPFSTLLENSCGSVLYGYLMLVFMITSSLMAVIISNTIYWIDPTAISYSCTIGLSGVVFLLVTVNCHWVTTPRSFILFPQSSFIGHLGGIVAAYIYLYRYLDIIMPSDHLIISIQSSNHLQSIVNLNYFISFNPLNLHFNNNSNQNLDNGTNNNNGYFSRISSYFQQQQQNNNNNNNSTTFNGQGRKY